MKLLFDQNLSHRLCTLLADLFPGSDQVHAIGLDRAEDREIWERAKAGAFILVSQDSDFAELAAVAGSPPKVIWLRCGNKPTPAIADLLRAHAEAIAAFAADEDAACLEIY